MANAMVVSFSLPAKLVKEINAHAKLLGMKKSELVASALAEHLDEIREEAAYVEAVYKATRKEKKYTMPELKRALGLA